ncbi:MAG: hypothetical protein PHN64_03435 [Desulfovibrionaceae bacterium]|nr:hypothetical protein [Desulfovibrionaceae bacterium]
MNCSIFLLPDAAVLLALTSLVLSFSLSVHGLVKAFQKRKEG